MDFGSLAILLMIAALILLVAEIFLPSGGMLAVMTICAMFASVYCGYRQWFDSSPLYFWGFICTSGVMFPTTLAGAFYILPKTSFGKQVILSAPDESQVRGHAREEQELEQLIGRRGTAVNTLMPGGLVEIDGIRHHASSQGMPIESGHPVEVLRRSGLRLIVKQVDSLEQESLSSSEPIEEQKKDRDDNDDLVDPLDIDFAQG